MNLMHPKPFSLVSKAIRQSAKGEPCLMRSAWCNHDPETTVFCHAPVRRFSLGGVAGKVPDLFGYYGCNGCHGHEMHFEHEDILRAMMFTQIRLIKKEIIEVKE